MPSDKREIVKILARSAPFYSATASELEALAGASSLRRYAAGASVYLEGERAAAAWVAASGQVRVLGFLTPARTFQLERFGPGQLFGICCRVGGGFDRYLCTAVAEGELTAVRIPDAAFHSVYRRSAAVARATCEICARRLRGMRRLAGGGRRSARQRLAQVLLGLRETGGDEISATRHSLAMWVGAAPETVFRALANMRRKGIVKTGWGTVSVLDAAALAREAEGEYA